MIRMQKKNILIVFTGSMELGGIERSLLGLLDAIDYESYEVDLFLYGHHGSLFSLINKNVNLLPEYKELAYLRESMVTKLKQGCYYSAMLRLRDEIFRFIKPVNFDQTWAEVLEKCVPKIDKHYDIALGFFLPFDFLNKKVQADVKLGWIHTDYNSESADYSNLLKNYMQVDKIVAVSNECERSFNSIFPELGNKVTVIENILSQKFVLKKAQEPITDDFFKSDQDEKILLSIGRFTTAKNFDNIPEICALLLKMGCKVRWYLIGFGGDEQLIRQKIAQFKMEKYVIILGKKENPYPYIAACDLYVQPSRYEGKSVTVREAQILCKPVVITAYNTSASQLENGIDGVIVPMDNEKCAEGIMKVLNDKALQKKLKDNMRKRDYSNKDEIEKIYAMVR